LEYQYTIPRLKWSITYAGLEFYREIATPEFILSEILRSLLSLRMTESEGARNDNPLSLRGAVNRVKGDEAI